VNTQSSPTIQVDSFQRAAAGNAGDAEIAAQSEAMKIAGITAIIYGLILLGASALDFWKSGSPVSLVIGLLCGPVMVVSGRYLLRERFVAAFVVVGVGILTGLFFGYRFIVTAELVPGGLMLVTSFLSLFAILVGLFTWLASESSNPPGGKG